MLIDVADAGLNHDLAALLKQKGIAAEVSSLTVDIDRYVVFVRVAPESAEAVRALTWELGGAIKSRAATELGKEIDAVYWKFPGAVR